MASLKEDNINFDKIELGVHKAIDAENLYWLQNDAKFRAVKQKGSYDEFKEIVAAAHLNPLAKDDKIQLQEKIVSPWNSLGKSGNTAAQVKGTICEETVGFQVPTSSHTFILQWRKQKTDEDKANFLHQMLSVNDVSDRMVTLFKTEIPFGLLGEFIISISSQLESFDCKLLEELLTALPQTGRFNLCLTFLSTIEKDQLKRIFDSLKKSEIHCTDLEQLYHM